MATDDLRIPIRVLRDRGELTPMQALAWWLCKASDGPGLTYAEAAEALGVGDRRQISTHLHRAKQRLEEE